ncbi:hypothetical protein GDO86_015977 [Hymenochirus boettgeri]|uniref:Uncharacterized protein n=1 Tax=Hymenochirus boettgeri TaxID=247094 RepID=A0A8T2K3J8_9PIPI|nr:hypothetical protein GDO86_015977 [Hymenochirus boettgeri]
MFREVRQQSRILDFCIIFWQYFRFKKNPKIKTKLGSWLNIALFAVLQSIALFAACIAGTELVAQTIFPCCWPKQHKYYITNVMSDTRPADPSGSYWLIHTRN